MHIRSVWGQEAEQAVALYLEKQGFSIRERNYRKRYGEIDLIAQNKEILAFVEVKMRHHDTVPLEMLITPSKQKRMLAVAYDYMTRYYTQLEKLNCRFDVVLVAYKGQVPEITHIPNAFMESDVRYHARNF